MPQNAGVAVRFRPFLLGPIFKAQGWATSPFNLYPAKGRHMWRDLERLCADLGLPFRRPDPFPQNSLLAARVALVGLAEDWATRAGARISAARCSGPNSATAAGSTMPRPSPTSSRDCRSSRSRCSQPPSPTRSRRSCGRETEAAERLGIFGAPSFTTADGELFWGNDRLEQALRWAKRANSE